MTEDAHMGSTRSAPTQIVRLTGFCAKAIVFGLAYFSLPVLAGPHFMTDDPEPAEYKHHEFYIATQQVKTTDGKVGTFPPSNITTVWRQTCTCTCLLQTILSYR